MSNKTMTACDRCNLVRSHTWWRPTDQLELRLCDMHETKHWIALTAQGFTEKYPPLDDDPVQVIRTGGTEARECG